MPFANLENIFNTFKLRKLWLINLLNGFFHISHNKTIKRKL